MKRSNILLISLCILFACSCSKTNNEDYGNLVSIVITERNNIAKLATVQYYEDMVLFDIDKNNDTNAVVIFHPELKLGIDLASLTEDDFDLRGDTVFINIPAPTVIESKCNPKQRDIIYCDSKWNIDSRIAELSEQAQKQIVEDAINNGLMEKAGNNAVEVMKDLYSATTSLTVEMGFKDEEINLFLNNQKN